MDKKMSPGVGVGLIAAVVIIVGAVGYFAFLKPKSGGGTANREEMMSKPELKAYKEKMEQMKASKGGVGGGGGSTGKMPYGYPRRQ